MVQVIEKIDIGRDAPSGRLYYDEKIAQERFKLPAGKKNIFLYDTALLCFYFLRDKRFRQIASVIFKLIKRISKKDIAVPLYIKDAFIELNSTFIKIGQFLSSRQDLLPKEHTKVLAELQDSLPPISFNNIKQIIETEFRKPIETVFKYINPECLASASIGQVHKAELLNGQEVVLKIQRPNLKSLFYQDLAILRCLATYFERHTEFGKEREWVKIVDEIGKTLFEEIDFIQEGRNADRFRKNLKYEERIYIPKIFWQFTTRKLITIEFVPGIKITDINSLKENNLDTKELAQVLVNAYFKQFFEDGFYHADPHPGNIVAKKDGTIVFYDFGMVARLNEKIREELANVLVSIIGSDTETLLNTLKRLELIKSGADLNPIKRIIEQAAYKYYDGSKLNTLDLNGIEDDIKKVFDEKPMKLPSKFTYTLRMTGSLEGVCRTLDPDFSLIAAARPYFLNWIIEKSPESRWFYLKSLFPKQKNLIEKVKIYFDVIKELPKYVTSKELVTKETELKPQANTEKQETENNYLKKEIKEVNSNLNQAYAIVLLLFSVLFGSYLVKTDSTIVSNLGIALLSCSLVGSIAVVSWSLANYKVLE